MADQEGGGATRLNHILNISRRQALLSPELSDLICFRLLSSISSSIPISSQSLAATFKSFRRSFSFGFADSAEAAGRKPTEETVVRDNQ